MGLPEAKHFAYSNEREAKAGLDVYLNFYNSQRPNKALDCRTPRYSTGIERDQRCNLRREIGRQAEHW